MLRRTRQSLSLFCAGLLGILLAAGSTFAWTAPGTAIDNVARASYRIDGTTTVVQTSNPVRITTVLGRSPASVALLRYAPTATGAGSTPIRATDVSLDGSPTGPFVALAAPVPAGSTAPLPLGTLPTVPGPLFHGGEAILLLVADYDQNLDPTSIESVLVTVGAPQTGDREVLRLYETAPDSGRFSGYLGSALGIGTSGDGQLAVAADGQIDVRYVDRSDSGDTASDQALVDPYGLVFDSRSGLPVNGATITLIDADTGLPAAVFGDDGSSPFPASVVSGSNVSDAAGAAYAFGPGRFRFPFLAPGRYRFQIDPPPGYAAPSVVATGELQALPGAPYALATGSRGEPFTLDPGPALHLDIPLDPASAGLWLTKATHKETAGIGEGVPYQLTVENRSATLTAFAVTIGDRIPPGFRYQSGSTRIDGVAAADPAIGADGRTLTFAVGDLAAAGRRQVDYVLLLGAGVQPGPAVNLALAADGLGARSNQATATIAVREDLLRSHATVAGRVLVGDCGDDPAALAGLAGLRLYLENGSFAVTDAEGRYHFAGLVPGTHVLQLDLDTLPPGYELLACEENTRFAGRAYSQFVDLQGGTLWRADFRIGRTPPPSGHATLELRGAVAGAGATFRLPLQLGAVALRNLRLTVILPEGLTFRGGSARLGAVPLDDPQGNGPALTWRLGDRPAGWNDHVTFSAAIDQRRTLELPVKALLTFDAPQQRNQRTPLAETLLFVSVAETSEPIPDFTVRPHFPTFVAELAAEDHAQLDAIIAKLKPFRATSLRAAGHTDNVGIATRSRHIYADNFALSRARAHTVARYLGEGLGIPPEKIFVEGHADTRPLAANDTEAGRALNRRVELFLSGEKLNHTVQTGTLKGESGPQRTATVGLRPGEDWPGETPLAAAAADDAPPAFDKAWLDRQGAGIEWVWPPAGAIPPIPSLKLVVKHLPGQQVAVRVNGEETAPLTYDGTLVGSSGAVARSLWRGVEIRNGDNRVEIVVGDSAGREIRRISRTIHRSYAPVRAELLPEASRLIADGRTRPVLAVRLTDKDGYPACEGVVGDFTLNAPFRPLLRRDGGSDANAHGSARPRFLVGRDGIARIELEPTVQTGDVVLRLALDGREEELRAWLRPALRDWILVGLAEGSAGYNTVAGNMENLTASDAEDAFHADGRLAFYAKGKIKGSWLLTLAYDSAKEREQTLQGTIDPDRYYPLYGDASEQRYDAASAEKLYLKLERGQFYALYGDHETGLTVTELARYSRSLTGLKSEYRGGSYGYSAFAADTRQAFVRDELRGDGTSGLYRLSRRDLVLNSEKVRIETRDRFHSETILKSRPLTRHLDYNIDYEAGTLFFKEPVPSRDAGFNPVFVVVEYEAGDRRDRTLHYGGRAYLRPFGGKLELGASYVREGSKGADGTLTGVDSTLQLGPGTAIETEFAASDAWRNGLRQEGNAWRAELEHRTARIDGRLYLREVDGGFGLGQQSASEIGTRKFGGAGRYLFGERFAVEGELSRQTTLQSGAERDLGEVRLSYRHADGNVRFGLRRADDRFADGTNSSTQLLTGGSWQLTPRSAFHLEHDQTLAGRGASADYPTRTRFGLDYRLSDAATVFVEQELSWGTAEESRMTRFGVKATPWSGGQFTSALEGRQTEYGPRLFATTGLKQSWQIDRHWSADAGLDRSETIRHPGNRPVNPQAAPASGAAEDFTAVSLGLNRSDKLWSWSNRAEARWGESEDKWTLLTALQGEVHPGLGLMSRLLASSSAKRADRQERFELRCGLAWRQSGSRWIVYDRLDLQFDRRESPGSSFDGWRAVNNLNANLRYDRRLQLALQYGAKYVQETIAARDYGGYTDLLGLEGRYDLTATWDVGAHGRVLHSWEAGQFDYGAGVSVGRKLARNAWLSVGYNLLGFEDRDFSAADFTARGPFVKFRFKFDQNTVREALQAL